MRGRNPEHFGQSLSRRGKWVMGTIGAFLLVIVAGVGVWSVVNQGSYGPSQNGCVNLTVVSSTGGAVIHDCGAKARALCRSAYSQNDKLARLTRPQCRLAGIGPTQP
ncbi:MAG TPA: hypothetical protein VMV92_38485 [Streptosporangiaceae bacterium]|nr:hypothetical protein [Streptosporangiaceae bacterium]